MKAKVTLVTIFVMTFLVTLAWQVDTANARAKIITDGLISYWTFDSSTINGTTVSDVIGGNNGTMKGDAKVVAGKFSEGMSFSGAGSVDYNDSKMPPGKAPRTMSAWVNVPALGNTLSVVEYGTNAATQRCGILVLGSGVIYFVGQGADLPSVATVAANTWTFVGITFDGTTMKIYKNGVLDQTGAVAIDTKLSVGRIGTNIRDGETFTGVIDEVAIYGRALSDAEMALNFNAVITAVAPNEKLASTWGELKTSR